MHSETIFSLDLNTLHIALLSLSVQMQSMCFEYDLQSSSLFLLKLCISIKPRLLQKFLARTVIGVCSSLTLNFNQSFIHEDFLPILGYWNMHMILKNQFRTNGLCIFKNGVIIFNSTLQATRIPTVKKRLIVQWYMPYYHNTCSPFINFKFIFCLFKQIWFCYGTHIRQNNYSSYGTNSLTMQV